ncbi:cytochrome P450 [Streptomyces radiopugnans]|uniref:Fatty-acid peroxygenase n=1 Tax=Streptomyces radiopugnans TaxID=403935 RepID=A0A1H9DR08_9ACTN|nr:cytochrome P450 [Streptomyces radiopugnans]SEQ15859.1 fatty-acid peroxygenase [Streptomyces radiopugnans]
MSLSRLLPDSTLSLLARGYAWLPDRMRRTTGPLVRARLLGKPTVALRGPEAVRFVYDERHVRRGPALPEPVKSTLFGHGAVHTLDGEAHRVRKAMFLSLLKSPQNIAGLVGDATAAWDEAAARWAERERVVLFDEASRVLAGAVCRWAGVPLKEAEAESAARDLVAMVDGFATLGPRHWRARSARRRREAWLASLVEAVRDGSASVPEGSVVDVVARHVDADGERLDARTAAVEILNVLRPTVAVCWFVAFAAHALHRWPEHRARLAEEARTGAGHGFGGAYAEAFAHEVRRFYPFAPFIGGLAAADLTWRGEPVPRGALVLLDIHGQDHDPALWEDPYSFDPRRFLDRPPERDELIPQGGGDPATGHRCPGEDVTVALLTALSARLSLLEYDVPEQDLRIPLRRIPSRPRSGFVVANVRPPG